MDVLLTKGWGSGGADRRNLSCLRHPGSGEPGPPESASTGGVSGRRSGSVRGKLSSSGIGAGLLAITAVVGIGCGGSDDEGRVAVTGLVTLDGRPLDAGHVTLRPLGKGPAVSGTISEGAFQLASSVGPAIGPYLVEIDAVRPTGRIIDNPDIYGEKQEETANIIPPKYNRESILRVEVVADRENHFELPVRSR